MKPVFRIFGIMIVLSSLSAPSRAQEIVNANLKVLDGINSVTSVFGAELVLKKDRKLLGAIKCGRLNGNILLLEKGYEKYRFDSEEKCRAAMVAVQDTLKLKPLIEVDLQSGSVVKISNEVALSGCAK